MTRYLLNSAVISEPGTYTYRLVEHEEAARWLGLPFASGVGYPETAREIRRRFGIDVQLSRDLNSMSPGDEALVVRLNYRVQQHRQKRDQRGLLLSAEAWEIGLLCRIS